MKLTSRGRFSAGVLIGLGFSALLFNDPILSLTFIGLFLLVMSEFAWMTIVVFRPSRFFILSSPSPTTAQSRKGKNEEVAKQKIEPIRKSVPLGEGTTQEFCFTMRARSHVSLSTEVPFLKITPGEFQSDTRKSRIQFEFRSPFAGFYPVEKIRLDFRGPLNLFETSSSLDLALHYSVYPKVYDIALQSSMIFEKSGIGEIPTESPGIGTEFYDMREYQLGDDIRQVNWKAFARLGELFVNDHAREVGGAYYLVLESNSTSYFDRDRLVSTFLQIANILTALGANFGFIVHDGRNVIAFKEIDRPFGSLELARKAALDLAEIRHLQIVEELLVPFPSHTIKSTRDMLSKDGLTLLSEIEHIAQHQMTASLGQSDAFKTIMDLMKENYSEPPAILYITGVSYSIAPIIEMSSEIRRAYNSEFIVAIPTAPWIVAQDEYQAAKLYELHLKNLKILANSNVRYYASDPLKVATQLFT